MLDWRPRDPAVPREEFITLNFFYEEFSTLDFISAFTRESDDEIP